MCWGATIGRVLSSIFFTVHHASVSDVASPAQCIAPAARPAVCLDGVAVHAVSLGVQVRILLVYLLL